MNTNSFLPVISFSLCRVHPGETLIQISKSERKLQIKMLMSQVKRNPHLRQVTLMSTQYSLSPYRNFFIWKMRTSERNIATNYPQPQRKQQSHLVLYFFCPFFPVQLIMRLSYLLSILSKRVQFFSTNLDTSGLIKPNLEDNKHPELNHFYGVSS